MSFTAYAQMALAQVSEAFAHLGFPDYFRVELSWANLQQLLTPPRLPGWCSVW